MTIQGRAMRSLVFVAAALVAACGGGGGGDANFGGTSIWPIAGHYTGTRAEATVDGRGYMLAGASRNDASTSDVVTFSGTMVEQPGGQWSIPFAAISTTIANTGLPVERRTMRGTVTGTFAARDTITFTLPALALPPGMAATHTVTYNRATAVTVEQVVGHYVEQGGTPVHPLTIREWDVSTAARFWGTYVTGCQFDGTLYSLFPISPVLSVDAVFTGPNCPDASGYERRLIGIFNPATGGSPASLRMQFADNGGTLHTIFGFRLGGN